MKITEVTKTKDIRQMLKDLVKTEIQSLPQMLDKLDERERVFFLVKILPYVLPKVEAVSSDFGEPSRITFDN
jgi:hypothetical protein